MPKLESWADLFKFNKEVLDDDFNPGQAFVAKLKNKSADGTTVITSLTSYQLFINISLICIGVHNHVQAGHS